MAKQIKTIVRAGKSAPNGVYALYFGNEGRLFLTIEDMSAGSTGNSQTIIFSKSEAELFANTILRGI